MRKFHIIISLMLLFPNLYGCSNTESDDPAKNINDQVKSIISRDHIENVNGYSFVMRKEPDTLEITVLIDNSKMNIAYEYSDDNYSDAKRNEGFDRFLGEPEFELDSALASRYSFVALMKYIEDSSGYVVGEGVRNIEALSFDNNEVRLQIAMSGKDATKCYKIIDSKFEQVNECDF